MVQAADSMLSLSIINDQGNVRFGSSLTHHLDIDALSSQDAKHLPKTPHRHVGITRKACSTWDGHLLRVQLFEDIPKSEKEHELFKVLVRLNSAAEVQSRADRR